MPTSTAFARALKDAAKIFDPERFEDMKEGQEAVSDNAKPVCETVYDLAKRSEGTIYEDEMQRIKNDLKGKMTIEGL